MLVSAVIGFCWGLWAVWWPNELGLGAATSVSSFASHALVYSLLFTGSWMLLGRVQSDWFRVGRLETGILAGLVAFVFLFARVPANLSAAWVLPPLLLLTAIGLRRGARREPQRDVIDNFLGRIPITRALALILIPLTAIATYAPFRLLDLHPATNIVLYVVTMPLGFWFFFRAVWHAIAQDRQEIRSPDENLASMP